MHLSSFASTPTKAISEKCCLSNRTLRLPIEQLNYVVAEVRENEMGKVVFTSPDLPGGMFDISIKTKMYPPSGQKRVDKARSWYYWTWGATWVSAIAAWVINGIYTSQSDALNKSIATTGTYDPDFRENTRIIYNVSIGALIAVGAVVTYQFIQLGHYLHTATENVTPIVKQRKEKK